MVGHEDLQKLKPVLHAAALTNLRSGTGPNWEQAHVAKVKKTVANSLALSRKSEAVIPYYM